jgi:UDP-glucose 4-epimerase
MSIEKNILITGGAGFIGSHTAVALHQAGLRPIIVDNLSNTRMEMIEGIEDIIQQKLTFYPFDCCDKEQIQSVFNDHVIDGVIHFAAFKSVAESVLEPQKYLDNNMGSLQVVLGCMQESGVNNLVFSSSATVYGEPDINPVTEETPFKKAASPYGETKQLGEEFIQSHCKENIDFNAALLRYFNPIGAHPSSKIGELPLGIPNNLLPLVNQAAKGERVLKIFGNDYNTPDGTCLRDYIHVMDLAEAHVAALRWLFNQKGTCEAFNLGQGKGDSVLSVIQNFESINEVTIPFEWSDRRPGDVEQIWANPSKAKSMLGWNTQRSTADALRDSWNFAKK